MNPPKIQVYCTVREDELEAGPNGLVCTRCIRNLVNLNDPASASKASGCGFLRRLGAPALASTMLLSACQAKPESRQMMLGKIAPGATTATEAPKAPEKEPRKPQPPPPPRPVLPGLIAPPPPPPPPKKEEPAKRGAPEKKKSEPVEGPRQIIMGDVAAAPVPRSEDWPIAPPHPGQPGYVTSPYTGKPVDVVSFEAGSLICDPAYPMSARKYFRIIEAV